MSFAAPGLYRGVGDKPSHRGPISQNPDQAIAKLAAGQHGNVTRSQLLGIGLTRKAIDYRRRSGRLHRVYPGVYAVGRPPSSPRERAAAAVLASGPHAVLSHGSALALWGLTKRWPATPHVTVTTGDRRPRNIETHRSRTLDRRDLTTTFAIRVTTPARAILDSAPGMTRKAVTRAVNDARLAHILTPADVADVIRRNPIHPGAKSLKPHAEPTRSGPTRSAFEDLFAQICRDHGLPTPVFNITLDGYEVDAYFPEQGLIVELDGWDFHQTREAFESDRERDAHNLAAGRRTVRVTWDRLHERPDAEAERIGRILSA